MKIAFSPPKARIVAVVIVACMVGHLIQKHVRLDTIQLRLPDLEPVHALAALAIVCITVAGIARLFRNSR